MQNRTEPDIHYYFGTLRISTFEIQFGINIPAILTA